MSNKGIPITGKPDWMSQEDWNLIVAYSFSTNTPPAFYVAAIDINTWNHMTRDEKIDWMSRWGHASAKHMQQDVTPETIEKTAKEAGLKTDVGKWSSAVFEKYLGMGGKTMTNLPPSPPPEEHHGGENQQPGQPSGGENQQPHQPSGGENQQPGTSVPKIIDVNDILSLQKYVRENYVRALNEYKKWKYIALVVFDVSSEKDILT